MPEVNADQLHHIKKGIVANPNCVAIPLCVAVHPLRKLGTIKRIVVSTYQSSSGKGAKGLVDFAQENVLLRGIALGKLFGSGLGTLRTQGQCGRFLLLKERWGAV